MTKRFYVTPEGKDERVIDIVDDGDIIKQLDHDSSIVRLDDDLYEVSSGDLRTTVVIVSRNQDSVRLSVGGRLLDVNVSNEGERLIKKLGIDLAAHRKLKDLKAPMPGLVLKVLVEEGQEINKGDGLLVLEAMKMENQIKATGDAVVEEVCITEGTAVEKGQVLIKFN